MPGFTSYDQMISSISSSGQIIDINFQKVTGTMEAAGVWASCWRVANSPAAGDDTGGALTNYAGSMNIPDQAGAYKHLLTFGACSNYSGTLMLYDRLVQVPSISTVGTGDKAVNTGALPRYTNGIGVQCWLEVTQATNTTAPIVHLHSYTDDDNNNSQDSTTNFTFPAAATDLNTLVGPLPLLAADKGLRAVATLNVGTASASTGTVNVILMKPLAYLPLAANQWNERDMVLQLAGLPRIYDGASLALAFCPNATNSATIYGQIRIGWA